MIILLDDLFFEIDEILTKAFGHLWIGKMGSNKYQELLAMSASKRDAHISKLILLSKKELEQYKKGLLSF